MDWAVMLIVMEASLLLHNTISQAKTELNRHPLFHLEPYWRFCLYTALNKEFAPIQMEGGEHSFLRILPLFHISTITTLKVLPVWKAIFPHDDLPQRLLAASVEQLKQQSLSDQMKNFFRDSEDTLVEISGRKSEQVQRAACVGIAARKVLLLASFHGDNFMDSFARRVDSQYRREVDLDYYNSDASRWAAISYANGIWSPHFDRQKSKEFWTWWIDEAVPEAWRRLQEDAL